MSAGPPPLRLWTEVPSRLGNGPAIFMRALRGRIGAGAAANLGSQAVSLAIQLFSVPLLLRAWGPELYGSWIMVASVASYLSMSDLGFSQAATVEMTTAVAQGDIGRAAAIQQSTFALVVGLAICAFGLVCLTTGSLVLWPATRPLVNHFGPVVLMLTASTLLGLSTSVVGSSLTAQGLYSRAVWFTSAVRFAEGALIIISAGAAHTLAAAAAGSLVARAAGLAGGLVLASVLVPWFRPGFKAVKLEHIRRLAGPALATMVIPLAFALGLQGTTIAVGLCLGTYAVTLFSASRTLARLTTQATSIVSLAVMPELARASGAGDSGRVTRLVRKNAAIAVAVAVSCGAALFVLGPAAMSRWTNGQASPPRLVFYAMVVGAALQGLWLSNGNMLIGINRQSRFAYAFAAVMATSVFASYWLGKSFGLAGPAMVTVAAEALMCLWIFWKIREEWGANATPG